MERSKVTPQSSKTFLQPLHMTNRGAVASIDHTFIQCTGGAPFFSLFRHILMHGTLSPNEPGWRVRRLRTGHDAMVIAPQELTDLLLELV